MAIDEYIGKVHNLDALELLKALPDASVDITVMSPPYNLKRANNKSGIFAHHTSNFLFDSGYDNFDDNIPENDYQLWIKNVISECLRVSKGIVWLNHKMRFVNGEGIHPLRFLPFPVWSEIIWNRRSSMALNARKFAPSHEYLFGFGRPHYWNSKYNTYMTVWNITRGSANGDSEHPCPYPPQLIEPLILASCPENGIVLDPFGGSGTTGQVAQKNNRQYILSDISKKYCALMEKRLGMAYTPNMFEVRQP